MQNLLMTAAEYGILMMTITQHVTWVQIPGGYRGYSPSKNFPGWAKCCISPQKMTKYAPSPKIASPPSKIYLHPWPTDYDDDDDDNTREHCLPDCGVPMRVSLVSGQSSSSSSLRTMQGLNFRPLDQTRP